LFAGTKAKPQQGVGKTESRPHDAARGWEGRENKTLLG